MSSSFSPCPSRMPTDRLRDRLRQASEGRQAWAHGMLMEQKLRQVGDILESPYRPHLPGHARECIAEHAAVLTSRSR